MEIKPTQANKTDKKEKPVKLSKTQIHLIKEMQNGIIVNYIQGLNSFCWISNQHKNINWLTIWRLEQLGLIERKDRYVVLTENGKNFKTA